MKRLLLALGLLACGCAGSVTSTPAPVVVQGNVDVSIQPVDGATRYAISVVDPISLEPVAPEVTTAALGASLPDVPPGNWRLRVRALDGPGTVSHTFFSLNPGEKSRVKADSFVPESQAPQPFPFRVEPSPPDLAALNQVQYFIIVYMENQSFDGMFPFYPGADGIQFAGPRVVQRNLDGSVIPGYVYTNDTAKNTYVSASAIEPSDAYPLKLPAHPYDLLPIAPTSSLVGDMVHQFVNEQRQIHGGAMDLVAAWSNNPGLVESSYDSAALGSPIAQLAASGVLCDHFFHSAFGDTWHNEFFFISGGPAVWLGPPSPSLEINQDATSPTDSTLARPLATVGGQTFIVQFPPDFQKGPVAGQTLQTAPTIGDRLSQAGVTWTYYGSADPEINPFLWFQNYQVGSPGYQAHFQPDFLTAVQGGTLPQVSFVRPNLDESEHPDISTYDAGQQFLAQVVGAVRANPDIWSQCAIIITFDENGGRWDHVSPPPVAPDGLGPGMRVPTLVLSPFVTAGRVDHTPYESVSVLKTLQLRYGLAPLTQRVSDATDMSHAFTAP